MSTKSYNTGVSKETKESQAKGGVSKKKVKISSAQKNKVSATASKEPQLDEVRAKKLKRHFYWTNPRRVLPASGRGVGED